MKPQNRGIGILPSLLISAQCGCFASLNSPNNVAKIVGSFRGCSQIGKIINLSLFSPYPETIEFGKYDPSTKDKSGKRHFGKFFDEHESGHLVFNGMVNIPVKGKNQAIPVLLIPNNNYDLDSDGVVTRNSQGKMAILIRDKTMQHRKNVLMHEYTVCKWLLENPWVVCETDEIHRQARVSEVYNDRYAESQAALLDEFSSINSAVLENHDSWSAIDEWQELTGVRGLIRSLLILQPVVENLEKEFGLTKRFKYYMKIKKEKSQEAQEVLKQLVLLLFKNDIVRMLEGEEKAVKDKEVIFYNYDNHNWVTSQAAELFFDLLGMVRYLHYYINEQMHRGPLNQQSKKVIIHLLGFYVLFLENVMHPYTIDFQYIKELLCNDQTNFINSVGFPKLTYASILLPYYRYQYRLPENQTLVVGT